MWTFPGGHQEAGEEVQETIVREILEETNINLPNLDKIGELKLNRFINLIIFVKRINSGDHDIQCGEGVDLQFFSEIELKFLVKPKSFDIIFDFLNTNLITKRKFKLRS